MAMLRFEEMLQCFEVCAIQCQLQKQYQEPRWQVEYYKYSLIPATARNLEESAQCSGEGDRALHTYQVSLSGKIHRPLIWSGVLHILRLWSNFSEWWAPNQNAQELENMLMGLVYLRRTSKYLFFALSFIGSTRSLKTVLKVLWGKSNGVNQKK